MFYSISFLQARKRTVILTRPSREDPLQLSLMGGYERGYGIFVERVERGSKAAEVGLKRGDQVRDLQCRVTLQKLMKFYTRFKFKIDVR